MLHQLIHFLARSEKTNQKRGATPKAPYTGGCKKKIAETADSLYVLVRRDTPCIAHLRAGYRFEECAA